MTIKVGDMVRVTKDLSDLTCGGDYKVIDIWHNGVIIDDDVGDEHLLSHRNFTPPPQS